MDKETRLIFIDLIDDFQLLMDLMMEYKILTPNENIVAIDKNFRDLKMKLIFSNNGVLHDDLA